jgi:hypothetical protein
MASCSAGAAQVRFAIIPAFDAEVTLGAGEFRERGHDEIGRRMGAEEWRIGTVSEERISSRFMEARRGGKMITGKMMGQENHFTRHHSTIQLVEETIRDGQLDVTWLIRYEKIKS